MLRFLNFFLNQLKFILKLQKIGIEPITGLQIRVCYDFFSFLIQIYTVSTQKNWLNEMALLSTKSSYSNV